MSSSEMGLLFPDYSEKKDNSRPIHPDTWRDLEVDSLLKYMFPQTRLRQRVLPFFKNYLIDPDILNYRQEVIEDFLNNDELFTAFKNLEPQLIQFNLTSDMNRADDSAMYALIQRMSELNLYVSCTDYINSHLENLSLKSKALLSMRSKMKELVDDPLFQKLKDELPGIQKKMRSCMSISIGINLDAEMRPCEAALLSVNDYRYSHSNGLISSLLGSKEVDKTLTPLHTPPLKTISNGKIGMTLSAYDAGYQIDPMMIPLFNDLSKILKKTAIPLLKQIQEYKKLAVGLFRPLIEDIPVIIGVTGWMRKLMESGHRFTIPQYDLSGDKHLTVEENYNILLAEELGKKTVCSEIKLRPDAGFFILTGPNQGGKSVYLQSVGLTQLLAQWGFPVPGTKALIAIRDQILTHYPVQDKISDNAGRLGEESKRLLSLLKISSEDSLLLLNETFSTTHETEGMYIAEDVLVAILNAGISGILVTHMHTLAERRDEINTLSSSGYLGNLVSVVTEDQKGGIHKTYKVVEGPPQGRSYAREIAAQYGLTGENLKKVLEGGKELAG